MENPEEILHSLEEFAKFKPRTIPRELEEYLSFVAKTGDPVYQWSIIKSLFREKLINVITEFYETCPSVDIPPCPNVDIFNYDAMKNFILEKLDTFVAAPFTVQRICELLTSPRKEYNRIDKYMRALEKNILVVSTTEPGSHRAAENGDGIVNGVESEHLQDGTNDINIEEMDDALTWSQDQPSVQSTSKTETAELPPESTSEPQEANFTNSDTVITSCTTEEQPYVEIAPVSSDTPKEEAAVHVSNVSVTITAIPAAVQKRRDSIEPPQEQSNESTPEESPTTSESDSSSNEETSTSTKMENDKYTEPSFGTCSEFNSSSNDASILATVLCPTVVRPGKKPQEESQETEAEILKKENDRDESLTIEESTPKEPNETKPTEECQEKPVSNEEIKEQTSFEEKEAIPEIKEADKDKENTEVAPIETESDESLLFYNNSSEETKKETPDTTGVECEVPKEEVINPVDDKPISEVAEVKEKETAECPTEIQADLETEPNKAEESVAFVADTPMEVDVDEIEALATAEASPSVITDE